MADARKLAGRFLMALSCLLHGAAQAALEQRQQVQAGDNPTNSGVGYSVAFSGNWAVLGAVFADIGGQTDRGAAYVFRRDRHGWVYETRLVASTGFAGDLFGISVAIDGSTIVVGASGSDFPEESNRGAAYVFVRSPGAGWIQQAILRRNVPGTVRETNDAFGYSVAISGDRILVGAPVQESPDFPIPKGAVEGSAKHHIEGFGAVYYFSRSGSFWTEQQEFRPAEMQTNDDAFGFSVAMQGTRAVVGARFGDALVQNQGTAYVFEYQVASAQWVQQAKLFAGDGLALDTFGNGVAISRDTIVVGAPFDDVGSNAEQGSAYVYVRSGVSWPFQQKLLASDGAALDRFGWVVAVDGDRALAGTPGDDGDTGSAYAYRRTGTTWTQQPKLIASNRAASDQFGIWVAQRGDTALMGAWGKNPGGLPGSGVGYFFSDAQLGGGYILEQARTAITPGDADGGSNDRLGTSVAIAGRWVVAGAPNASATGSVYVFDRAPGAPVSATSTKQLEPWLVREPVRVAELGSATLAIGDKFGETVAIAEDGSRIVVGATEAGTGDSGEIFVFSRPPGGWGAEPVQATTPVSITAPCGFRDGFSVATAISADGTIVVGSPLNTFGPVISAGAVYVLKPNGSGYDQSCIATPSPQSSNRFGSSVAVFRSSLVVGAPDANSGEGTAYLYRLTTSGPVFRRELQRPAIAKAIGDKFATAVAVTEGTIVVGEPGMDTAAGANSGGAYVFADDGNTVVLDGTVEPVAGATASAAGTSVAIEDEHIVLGAPLADSAGGTDSGAAFVFTRPPGGWLADTTESGALVDAEGQPADRLGTSVALSDDGAVVGIPFHDEPRTDSGSAIDQGQVLIYDLLDVLLRDEFE